MEDSILNLRTVSQAGSETQMWPERFRCEGCPQRDVRVMGWRALTERDCKSAVLNTDDRQQKFLRMKFF